MRMEINQGKKIASKNEITYLGWKNQVSKRGINQGKKIRYKCGMENQVTEMGINQGTRIRYKFGMKTSSNKNRNKSGIQNSK